MAREHLAALINSRKDNIIFTSGATESLNTAIKGTAEVLSNKGKHIVTIETEHHAVLDPLLYLEKKGFEVTRLPVSSNGMIDIHLLQQSLRKDTIMVVAMWANNETGVIHDVSSIAAICNQHGVIFICDGTQAVGKIKVDVESSGVDMLAFSSHKMYGPKGCGALYISPKLKNFKLPPLIHGGGHEMGYRSGTLNVPGIAGFGKAAEISANEMDADEKRILELRDKFETKLLSSIESAEVNGDLAHRLPTVTNLRVKHVDSQAVMTRLRTKMAISSGSACSSADPTPSHVLLAMGLNAAEAKSSFRISMGRFTTSDEMEQATNWLAEAIQTYRSESPVWQMFKQGINIPDTTR
jgi:cysteine desulfurase